MKDMDHDPRFDEPGHMLVPPPPQQELREAVRAALSEVYDPEIPVNIVELGLIYALDCSEDGVVSIEMTLTAPNCPVAEELPIQVRAKALEVTWGEGRQGRAGLDSGLVDGLHVGSCAAATRDDVGQSQRALQNWSSQRTIWSATILGRSIGGR